MSTGMSAVNRALAARSWTIPRACHDERVEVIDPGSPQSWPDDIRAETERLAKIVRSIPGNQPTRPSYEMTLGFPERDFKAEREFRDFIGDRHVAYYHATRLLPHEDQMFIEGGLQVLSDDLRNRRLDRVMELYGDEIGAERLETLRGAGPASRGSSQRSGRLGILHGVTPLDAVLWGGWGMEVFLTNWGGESFYFVGRKESDLLATIDRLSDLSVPTVIETAARPHDLCDYKMLWTIFVARLDGWGDPWHEFSTRQSIPPERVLGILHPDSPRWPLDPNQPLDMDL